MSIKEKSSLNVCIRFRPLFESEQKAAQWKCSVLKTKDAQKKEVHQIKLLDNIQPTAVNNNGPSGDPFAKLMGTSNQNKKIGPKDKNEQQTYQYDRIFTQDEYNGDVYREVCQPIIYRCLDGFNGTIFAYGQTTSGKTHTMLGTSFDKGILLQSMTDIFKFIDDNQDTREVTLWGSYMEVYNEQVNDLLDQNNSNLKIREDPSEGYYVSGLKNIKI